MTIKNKLRAGISFLFILALLCCGLSIYFLNRLAADATSILKDNYVSVQYAKNIGSVVDANPGPFNQEQEKIIEDNLVKQEHNVTEPGEQQLTDSLRSQYEQLKLVHNDQNKTNQLHREI